MKGIVFRLLESFVDDHLSRDAFQDLVAQYGFVPGGLYIGPKTYPDEQIVALGRDISVRMGISFEEMLQRFGEFCFPRLARKHPEFVRRYAASHELLSDLNDVVHAKVEKFYGFTTTPMFRIRQDEFGQMLLEYDSSRPLCSFLEGMLKGAASFYGEKLSFEKLTCKQSGAEFCFYRLRWS